MEALNGYTCLGEKDRKKNPQESFSRQWLLPSSSYLFLYTFRFSRFYVDFCEAVITADAYSSESLFRGMKRSKNDKNLEHLDCQELVRSAYLTCQIPNQISFAHCFNKNLSYAGFLIFTLGLTFIVIPSTWLEHLS